MYVAPSAFFVGGIAAALHYFAYLNGRDRNDMAAELGVEEIVPDLFSPDDGTFIPPVAVVRRLSRGSIVEEDIVAGKTNNNSPAGAAGTQAGRASVDIK